MGLELMLWNIRTKVMYFFLIMWCINILIQLLLWAEKQCKGYWLERELEFLKNIDLAISQYKKCRNLYELEIPLLRNLLHRHIFINVQECINKPFVIILFIIFKIGKITPQFTVTEQQLNKWLYICMMTYYTIFTKY